MTRRAFLAALATSVVSANTKPVGLSFGTYGHRMLNWEDSLELIFRTGYDGVELAVLPDWPTSPERLSRYDRSRLRGRLSDLGLDLPALLDNLQAMHPTQSHSDNLERLRRAVELGADLAAGNPPFFETVLGRKPAEWDEVKRQMVDEVGDWARVAADAQTVICFKPHVGNAVNDIERSLWIVEQIGSPYFRCTYDYSHLWLAGHELVPSLEALLPVCSYIHLKDAEGERGSHRFLLPGEGTTDYVEMFHQLGKLGFEGFANVEVSAQIHRRDDYQPIATTRLCYERMAAAINEAGLTRRRQ